MKPTKLIAGLSLFTFAATAYADVQVDVTGATAFRAATLLAIRAKYDASGVAYKFAHDQATSGGTVYSGATRAIFIGTFPGVSGTTTIRCCFTGSVEGLRALVPVVDPLPPTYYQPSLLSSTTAIIGGAELANQGTTGAATDASEIAFSDVAKSSTPYAAYSLQPASPAAGVVVFTMLANEGSQVTNVTSQAFRALMGGYQPLSLFTGDENDNPNDIAGDGSNPNAGFVLGTGRNDGSGTRGAYLAETGFGVSKAVKQYVTTASTSTALSTVQLVPINGGSTPANASTVWGLSVDGNGGYNSGSQLRTDMGKTGASVNVLEANGSNTFGAPVRVDLVTWLSLNDAVTARDNGAVFCAFNGVKLNDIATSGTTMSAADKAKVTEGVYTAWSFENMYRRNDIANGTDAAKVYDGIKASIQTNLGAAGIPISEMNVGRPSDGGTVAP
jgi:hypothetical protein